MRIRSKLDGRGLDAQLRLVSHNGQRSFVLAVHADKQADVVLGPVAAALGYEIVASTPAEHAALRLAGYYLSDADTKELELLAPVQALRGQRFRYQRRLHPTLAKHTAWQPHLRSLTGSRKQQQTSERN